MEDLGRQIGTLIHWLFWTAVVLAVAVVTLVALILTGVL